MFDLNRFPGKKTVITKALFFLILSVIQRIDSSCHGDAPFIHNQILIYTLKPQDFFPNSNTHLNP